MSLVSVMALLGLIVGLIAERKDFTTDAGNRRISKLLVQVIYPCLIFSSLLLRFHWAEVVILARLPILLLVILVLGLLFGRLSLAKSGITSIPRQRSYVFLSIMPNYSYVPLVVGQMLWGDRGIALIAIIGVAADFSLWTFAYPQIAGKSDWKKILSPAFLSLIAAFLILYWVPERSGEGWTSLLGALSALGKLTIPLSMFILGVQLAKATKSLTNKRAHAYLLSWRLFLCPLILFVLILLFTRDLPFEARAALLLVGSMPGAVITVVLAQMHDADARFAASQILLGHILALATASLWQMALQYALL